MIEIFKDIKGYEGLYQVSNLGKVKSLNYRQTGKEHLLKQRKLKNGYLQVVLTKNGLSTQYYVHRLVAEVFIPNPNNYPIINHKSENKTENTIQNLEWVTYSYNNNYGTRNEKISTKIKCLDLQTNKLSYFSSINDCARQLNVYSTVIWKSIYKYKSPYRNRYIFSEVSD